MLAKELLSRRYVTVDINDTVAQFIGKIKLVNEHAALVFDENKYKGVVERRFVLNSKLDPNKMKIKNAVKKRSRGRIPFYVPSLSPDTELKEVCKLLVTANSRILPVIQKDKVIGVVRAKYVAKEIAKDYPIPCNDLASMKPICVNEKEKISKAITLMEKYGIDHLPIIDEKNELTGMISISDLMENINFWKVSGQKLSKAARHQGTKKSGYDAGEKTALRDLPVKTFMSKKEVCSVSPKTKITLAVKQMLENNVNSIVLAEFNEPVGILTISDLLKDYAKRR